MNLSFIILFLFVSCTSAIAQKEFGNIGGSSAGMGYTSVLNKDIFAVHNNQANLALLQGISAGLYSERPFLIPSLRLNALGIALPMKSGTFGLSLLNFGNKFFNQNKIGIAYAKKLSENFSAGIQLDYLSMSMQEYGTASAFTFEGSIRAQLTKQLILGAHIYNPLQVKWSSTDERIPAVMKLGIHYIPSAKVTVAAETEKNLDHQPVFKAGIEYKIVDKLFLRTGIATNPAVFTCGMGLHFKKITIDLATSYHTILGLTPHLSLIYIKKKAAL